MPCRPCRLIGEIDELALVQLGIQAAEGEQLGMAAHLTDSAHVDHTDDIGLDDCAEAMRDDDGSALGQEFLERVLDQRFRDHIDARGGFVHDQDARIRQDGAGDGNELALADGQVGAVFQDFGCITIGQVAHEGVEIGRSTSGGDLVVRGVGTSEADVLGNGAREDEGILRDQAHLRTHGTLLDLPDINAVDQQRAFAGIIEASDQIGDRRFARAGGSHQRDHRTRRKNRG